MTDKEDDDSPFRIFEGRSFEDGKSWNELHPPPPLPPPLSNEVVEKFENRCYFCFHRSWDVFESGAPMWSTCKHDAHQYGVGGDRYVECVRVAERYRGGKCPKFWPVILRAPLRAALFGVKSLLKRLHGG